MITKIAFERMPSLPQVLVKILDAINSEKSDFQSIAETIRHDTAVTAMVVSAANSSFFGNTKHCDSIERALLFLGTDAVKTIVITTSIKNFFGNFNQQHEQFLNTFWRRSLISANLAKVLATLTSYHSPDEAYLCGLLADVGQLILLTNSGQNYLDLLDGVNSDQQLLQAEQALFETTHCEISGDLISSWEIPGFMADAVRYHHEPAQAILDAHQLVKIINLSSLLSSEGDLDDKTLECANTLFGLNESLTRELLDRIGQDADNMARALGINIGDVGSDNNSQLGEKLEALTELAQMSSDLWRASHRDTLHDTISRSLFLTLGIEDSILFVHDSEHNIITGQTKIDDTTPSTFTIPLEPGRSLISDSQLSKTVLQSGASTDPLKIIDRQLLRILKTESFSCWPLMLDDNTAVGVLVLASNMQQLKALESKAVLRTSLCGEFAKLIDTNKQKLTQFETQNIDTEDYSQLVREAVHEASNPLSIIRNYLELLSIKLGEEHSVSTELNLIKEEIDRVGSILLRLKDPEQKADESGSLHINHVLESVTEIFKSSICTTKQISLKLDLDNAISEIPGNSEHLKQILTNLLKNAVEALSPGNSISVSSEASISFSGRDFSAIYVEDDGPGISDAIKKNLFSPVTSTKGTTHSGLGLSIVKKLIDEMGGSIVCRSSKENGTQFQLLLPKS